MINVNWSAKTLKEGISNMMSGAKADYERMSTGNFKKDLTGYSKEQYDYWDSKTKISEGKKYIKIVQDTGVLFVMKENSGNLKGDILRGGL